MVCSPAQLNSRSRVVIRSDNRGAKRNIAGIGPDRKRPGGPIHIRFIGNGGVSKNIRREDGAASERSIGQQKTDRESQEQIMFLHEFRYSQPHSGPSALLNDWACFHWRAGKIPCKAIRKFITR